MVPNKSLDESEIIAALLHSVHNAHGSVFNTRNCRLTILMVNKRLRKEGLGFLTKTLPRLCKAFDKAIAGDTPLNSVKLGFKPLPNSKLPRFLGEFFSGVLNSDGILLPYPCAQYVKVIREICYLFYKYELPYSDEQEQQVVSRFEKTEDDLSSHEKQLQEIGKCFSSSAPPRWDPLQDSSQVRTLRRARRLLTRLFSSFDPTDITPRHGPGVVATKQQLWGKYHWSNVSGRITEVYPLDAYFYASLGHVCDRMDSISRIRDEDLPAKVILVPKDSRGPRLISCEPVDFQWVQQGLGRAIVELVERHWLTKHNVHFTDQSPNRIGALAGSLAFRGEKPYDTTITGKYSTLDLNEASDRVSTELVRLLFPEHVYTYLVACRSSSTVLPSGKVITLRKFAPMGSCLCFPILALTIWAILTAAAPDAETRESLLVYGDDVIVPTTFVVNAIEQLESFGLKVNRDKSCISGLFRESCGMDAFAGVDVTPVRLRTVWSSLPRPESYASWIAYANQFYDRKYFRLYDLIVERLVSVYGPIPSDDMCLTCPSLREVPDDAKPKIKRWNRSLQKLEYRVYDLKSPSITKAMDGWLMLLRYFVEVGQSPIARLEGIHQRRHVNPFEGNEPFSVSLYTSRRTSVLVRRWR